MQREYARAGVLAGTAGGRAWFRQRGHPTPTPTCPDLARHTPRHNSRRCHGGRDPPANKITHLPGVGIAVAVALQQEGAAGLENDFVVDVGHVHDHAHAIPKVVLHHAPYYVRRQVIARVPYVRFLRVDQGVVQCREGVLTALRLAKAAMAAEAGCSPASTPLPAAVRRDAHHRTGEYTLAPEHQP